MSYIKAKWTRAMHGSTDQFYSIIGPSLLAICTLHPLPLQLTEKKKKKTMAPNHKSATVVERYGYDLLLASIAAFYILMVPYTKVEESFNVQVSLSLSHTHT